MKFVCYADWQQLPQSADALLASAAQDSIFFSRPWFENLVDAALPDQRSFKLASVVDKDRVLAILPLANRGNGHWQALTHLYSSLYTLTLVEENQQQIIRCLVEGLQRLRMVSLRIAPFAEDDQRIHRLQQAMECAGFECHRRFRFYNWIHRLRGQSYADYMAGRPSRVRHTIARKQRRLNRDYGYVVRFFSEQNLARGMADYDAVYQASWKAHEQYTDVVTGLARTLARLDWLRLAVLYIDEKPAAAQFWFVVHGKASIFKLVYDQAWKQYSPGSILMSHLMQRVIDVDQVEEVDFLTGNDAYKQDWMSERRQRWGLYCGQPVQHESRVKRVAGRLRDWIKTNNSRSIQE